MKRYAKHFMKSRDNLKDGERKIKDHLTHFIRDRNVVLSTHNQALNALVFLCKHLLEYLMNDPDPLRMSRLYSTEI